MVRLCHWQSFGKIFRSCRSQMFFKIDILKNFTNFTGKRLWWSLFLIKLLAWMPKRCNENRLQRYNKKKVQHEKSSAWKKCNKKSTTQNEYSWNRATWEECTKGITWKEYYTKKGEAWKECNMKKVQHKMSTTWKKMLLKNSAKWKKVQHGKV